MQIIFYKGNGNWFDKIIKWWTNSPYSHCEIVIDGVCYSSSPRDGGVRKKSIDYYNLKWDILKISCTKSQENKIREFFENQLGKKYDKLGIFLTQTIPIGIENKNRWFCSEICVAALAEAGIGSFSKKPKWYSPGGFYRCLINESLVVPIELY